MYSNTFLTLKNDEIESYLSLKYDAIEKIISKKNSVTFYEYR